MSTAADLATYVGEAPGDAYVAECWTQAQALVAQHVGDHDVPEAVLARATVEVGSELYHRRQAPNGVAQFAALDGAPVRVARDPMVAARPILAPFLPGGFA